MSEGPVEDPRKRCNSSRHQQKRRMLVEEQQHRKTNKVKKQIRRRRSEARSDVASGAAIAGWRRSEARSGVRSCLKGEALRAQGALLLQATSEPEPKFIFSVSRVRKAS